jgi:hypothetical protein
MMDSLKKILCALACAFFSSLTGLMPVLLRQGPAMLFFYYSEYILYLLLYTISCFGVIYLFMYLKTSPGKRKFAVPLGITILALAIITLIIVVQSVITMKFPYPSDMGWLFTFHDIFALFLAPSGALFLVTIRTEINEYWVIILMIMTGLGLCSLMMLGEFLLQIPGSPLYLFSPVVDMLSGMSFLIIAGWFIKETPH